MVTTKQEVSKHFANLKVEIDRAENDCKDLKSRINMYSEKRDIMEGGQDEKELETCQKIVDMMNTKKDGRMEFIEMSAIDKSMLNAQLPVIPEQIMATG